MSRTENPKGFFRTCGWDQSRDSRRLRNDSRIMKTTKATRKEITDFFHAIDTFNFIIEGIRDDMQDTYDNRSEKWQEGDAGNQMQADIENLEEISSALEELVQKIDELFEE